MIGELRKIQKPHRARPNIVMTETPLGGSILRIENHTVVSFSLLEDGIRVAASVMTVYRYYAVGLLIGGVREIQKPNRARRNIAMTETPLGVPSSGTITAPLLVSILRRESLAAITKTVGFIWGP
ncbi:hypothetical protein [Pseudomonas sp.]|uniref:hypothetical protein n=1 Tax=Pseudomonas sp. TaxID=306 RepID=UPI00257FCE33|nr:hypothetical protein [Pseudomonas sp.]